ncbi:P-loop NTPase fold protein [Enterococcus casseliflavus]|uniref:P-loop NTPase fold protein n=1 Tax=Enterococcus casseliflavus TaxID=37734 RepID=UPI0039A5E863
MNIQDMKPLSKIKSEGFYPATLSGKISNIEDIVKKFSTGIYVIGGDRGSGKTSLLNSIENQSTRTCAQNHGIIVAESEYFLHLNVVNKNTDLLRELILFLEQIYIKNAEKLNKEILNRIENIKEKVLFDIYLEEVEEEIRGERETSTSNFFLGIKASFSESIFSKVSLDTNSIKLSKNEIRNRRIKSPRQRREETVKEVVNLLSIFSDDFSIVVVLDELDKLDDISLEYFIEENKIVLVESPVIFFLVVDSQKYVNLKYDKKYSALDNLIREYIFLPRLNWQEFILVVPKLLKISSLKTLQSIYYETKGNFREIIKLKKDYNNYYSLKERRNKSGSISSKNIHSFEILIEIITNEYIMDLPEALNEIAIDFIHEVLEIANINSYITEQELLEIQEGYFSSNNVLNSVLNRVKEVVVNYTVSNKDEQSGTLKKELSKYYEPKNWVAFSKKYQYIELETTEIGILYQLLEIYYESVDGVIICKETKEDSFYNTSYTATILISNNYMKPLALVNKRGFAWNFEEFRRYGEMLKYLEDSQIKYIDIELPLKETIMDYINSLEVFYDRFKDKYKDY